MSPHLLQEVVGADLQGLDLGQQLHVFHLVIREHLEAIVIVVAEDTKTAAQSKLAPLLLPSGSAIPGHLVLHLQLSFLSLLHQLLKSLPLRRIQRSGVLQLPQNLQVAAFHLAGSGLQVGSLQGRGGSVNIGQVRRVPGALTLVIRLLSCSELVLHSLVSW